MTKPSLIVTVAGGVAYVASNLENVDVSIIDFDDLQAIIAEAPTGKDRHRLTSHDARYLIEHEEDFWIKLKPHVLVEE
jgi:hypothetical protein